MLIKQIGTELAQVVKDNKVVVGVGTAVVVGAIIYTKRAKILKKYNEIKAGATIMKQAVKETMNEEEIVDIQPEEEIKTV